MSVVGRLRGARGALTSPRPRTAEPRAVRTGAEHWQRRLRTLAQVLATEAGPVAPATGPLEAQVLELLRDADDQVTWLALAVLSARLPTAAQVVDARRAAQLAGPGRILDAARAAGTHASVTREVTVVTDRTLVDLGDLVLFPLGTGIQRVARNVGRAWRADRSFTAVAWTAGMDALRAIDDAVRDAALDPDGVPTTGPGLPHGTRDDRAAPDTVVVPWRCTYVLPELAVQPRRCASLQALAELSPTRCGVIGFDCVPLTSAETSATGFPAVFALNLAAVAHFDTVAAISQAAATEYRGWRTMLGGAGITGPDVQPVPLPAHAPEPTDQDLDEARRRFRVGDLPLVLCVGSHEPRKNHLAVLHAAELLWRRGHRFSLTFVGGNSWNSEEFTRRLGELAGAGRPVESVSRLDDRLLWAAYRLARFTVFPSLNEGFGLPVAESLAAGTPALTSSFGSMQEIAADGGALVVDPRDDHALAAEMARLLDDDGLHTDLVAQATARTSSSWEDYAARLWQLFHAG